MRTRCTSPSPSVSSCSRDGPYSFHDYFITSPFSGPDVNLLSAQGGCELQLTVFNIMSRRLTRERWVAE